MAVPSARRVWNFAKVYAALRDAPEAGALVVLGAGALCMSVYTMIRAYTPANESFPTKEARRDPELQAEYGKLYHKPSIYARIAGKYGSDDKGFKIGIFENRTRPYEYNLPVPGPVHSSPVHEAGLREGGGYAPAQ